MIESQKHLYFVGIGGIGMSSIARIYRAMGHRVSGSDLGPSSLTADLEQRGIRVGYEQALGTLPTDTGVVVRTAAVRDDHPEIKAARDRGVPVIKYVEALAQVMEGRRGIAICGTHGKTTTTAMTAVILRESGRDPSYVVGGRCDILGGSARLGNGPEFVAEACEYDRSFHALHPAIAVCTNVEGDHFDCYKDIDDVRDAFRTFFDERLDAGGLLLVNGDDVGAIESARDLAVMTETFGLSEGCTFRAIDIELGRITTFRLQIAGIQLGDIVLPVPGIHNVYNALAAISVACRLGVPFEDIRSGLKKFHGVKRRFDVQCNHPIAVIDDYAHHPSEVRATLRAARNRYGDRPIVALFQAHQYSRTRHFLDEFAEAFREADRVLICDIYACRDTEEDRQAVSAQALAARARQHGLQVQHIPGTPKEAAEAARKILWSGDVVVCMGAGTITKTAKHLACLVEPTDDGTPLAITEGTATEGFQNDLTKVWAKPKKRRFIC